MADGDPRDTLMEQIRSYAAEVKEWDIDDELDLHDRGTLFGIAAGSLQRALWDQRSDEEPGARFWQLLQALAGPGAAASATAAAPDAITVQNLDDPAELVTQAVQHGVGGFSMVQLLVLLLILTVIFGLPYLKEVLPSDMAAQLSTQEDGIQCVVGLIGGAIIAERKRRS
jgi:hypothetical protein